MSHYKTLEVPTNASADEIKKSYRKLSRKWHPDRNSSGGEKFKAISSAYEVLSDPDKRRQYDLGMNFHNGSRNGGSFFQQFFPPTVAKVENVITYNVKITLEQICQSKRLNISYTRRGKCPTCHGNMTTNTSIPLCASCNGTGSVTRHLNMMGIMNLPQTTPCSVCGGRGKVIRPVDVCLMCNCKGHVSEKCNAILDCKDYANHLTSYLGLQSNNLPVQKFHGKGHYSPILKDYSELRVHVKIKPHTRFTVSRLDLCTDYKISCREALTGFSATIKHPNGEDIEFVSPSGVVFTHDQKFKVPNCGINANGVKGDLYVKLKITVPCQITEDQQVKIRDILKNNS